jgi:hypothetical protein
MFKHLTWFRELLNGCLMARIKLLKLLLLLLLFTLQSQIHLE